MNNPESVDAYTEMTIYGGLSNFLMDKLNHSNDYLKIADIGCGPCGYYNTLLTLYPNSVFTGYEASALMLEKAHLSVNHEKVTLINSFIPDSSLPINTYDVVISSLFLHQLQDPKHCWNTIKQIGKKGAKFYVFDLLRVEESATCWGIVNGMASGSPEVFQTDFYNTLRASFKVEEVQQQLLDAGLVATITTQEVFANCNAITIQGTL
jgi:SAM-dependent methyltransferase